MADPPTLTPLDSEISVEKNGQVGIPKCESCSNRFPVPIYHPPLSPSIHSSQEAADNAEQHTTTGEQSNE